jgi:Uma2 family endonuclease
MATLVTDPSLAEQLIDQRRVSGSDRWDEVWEGTYVMTPLPNIEHQGLVGRLTTILTAVVADAGLGHVFPGVNVSDQADDWTKNYRCPDVAVYLEGTQAENRDTYWLGGPDFLIEVVSPEDRTREKLDFYAKVGTREALLIDRDPWAGELWRLDDGQLKLAGTSSVENGEVLASEVVPLTFKLVTGENRPVIEVARTDEQRNWQV